MCVFLISKTSCTEAFLCKLQARPLLSQAFENGNFDGLLDPKLQKNYNHDEMVRMAACAACCVRHSARLRPRMSQVSWLILKICLRIKGVFSFYNQIAVVIVSDKGYVVKCLPERHSPAYLGKKKSSVVLKHIKN